MQVLLPALKVGTVAAVCGLSYVTRRMVESKLGKRKSGGESVEQACPPTEEEAPGCKTPVLEATEVPASGVTEVVEPGREKEEEEEQEVVSASSAPLPVTDDDEEAAAVLAEALGSQGDSQLLPALAATAGACVQLGSGDKADSSYGMGEQPLVVQGGNAVGHGSMEERKEQAGSTKRTRLS